MRTDCVKHKTKPLRAGQASGDSASAGRPNSASSTWSLPERRDFAKQEADAHSHGESRHKGDDEPAALSQ